ncbi:MAG: ATP synthase F1 subunit delta [Planctomycetota bacterium]
MATDASQTRGHDTVLDVTGEQLAKVYAQAFLDAAGGSMNAVDAVAELKAVVSEILDQFPQFGEAVQSAFLSSEERVALIDRVLGGRVDTVVLNTLKVMSGHNRLSLLRTVATQAQELFNRDNGLVHVDVTSAAPLTPELTGSLEATLREKLGIVPVLQPTVDPEMIAGLKLRVGDTVYDGSLKTIFGKARQSIVERAIEKIEKSPEHFLSEESGPRANEGDEAEA